MTDDTPSAELAAFADLDVNTPNAARMYDYYLDGAHNFAADRALADQILAVAPQAAAGARANRAFLRRVVSYCLQHGIRQFLDLGSGVPTVGHVHEIAHATDPTARVAYVDSEAVAVVATERILANVPTATITRADLREPHTVLRAPTVTDLLDFTQPVAVLMVAVLHFVSDADDPAGIVATYADALAPGSYLALSHIDTSSEPEAALRRIRALYQNSTTPGYPRDRQQIAALLPPQLGLLDPGLVPVEHWRPDTTTGPEDVVGHFRGALTHKPG